MEVTRDVIIDLLPLYLAGEVSADTKALVEAYLEKDPRLAEIARGTANFRNEKEVPMPTNTEHQMEAYKEAQKMINQRTMIWGTVIAVAILAALGLALLAFFMLQSVM